MIRATTKFALINGALGSYFATSLARKMTIKNPLKKRRFFSENTSQYSRTILQMLGLDIKVKYDDPSIFDKNYLIVANHLSYLDIPIISSLKPSIFVTSVELRETPFLGDLAECGGSIFVERRSRKRLFKEISYVAENLNQGFNIVLFPESTSSNGETVLPFKKSFFRSAQEAGVEILPVCIQYLRVNEKPFSKKNRDDVCWYGDMTFLPHYLNLVRSRSIEAQINFLPTINPNDFSNTKELAAHAHEKIRDVYRGYN